MKFAFALMPVLLFAALNTIAYDLESIFQMPEWKTNHGWFENSDGNERARTYSVIMGPKETVLWIELQTTAYSCERLEYWASRNTYLQVGGTRLPYVGTRSNGKLHWTTYDDGSVAHWRTIWINGVRREYR